MASVRDLVECGETARTVERLVADAELVRVRRDAVVAATAWHAADPRARHRLRAWAVMRSVQSPKGESDTYALSHHSALAAFGLPVYGVDDRVHAVRVDNGRGRRTATLQVHPALPNSLLTAVADATTVPPAIACVQVADSFGVEAGLVSTDAALHEGMTTRDSLASALATARLGRGRHLAREVCDLADATVESPGESRTRWLLRCLGLPSPTPQAWILDPSGAAVARVDFLFEEFRTIIEFDGAVKYDGADSKQALFREKKREDRLRALGYQVVRLTWDDLRHPGRVRAQILAAFARAAA